jgi:hypothetical protein
MYISRLVKTRSPHSGLLQSLSGFRTLHPVSLISFPAHLYFSSSSSYPSSLSSYLSSLLHLSLVYIGGSAPTPSHIQRGPMSRTRSFIRFSELESLSLDVIRWLVT